MGSSHDCEDLLEFSNQVLWWLSLGVASHLCSISGCLGFPLLTMILRLAVAALGFACVAHARPQNDDDPFATVTSFFEITSAPAATTVPQPTETGCKALSEFQSNYQSAVPSGKQRSSFIDLLHGFI